MDAITVGILASSDVDIYRECLLYQITHCDDCDDLDFGGDWIEDDCGIMASLDDYLLYQCDTLLDNPCLLEGSDFVCSFLNALDSVEIISHEFFLVPSIHILTTQLVGVAREAAKYKYSLSRSAWLNLWMLWWKSCPRNWVAGMLTGWLRDIRQIQPQLSYYAVNLYTKNIGYLTNVDGFIRAVRDPDNAGAWINTVISEWVKRTIKLESNKSHVYNSLQRIGDLTGPLWTLAQSSRLYFSLGALPGSHLLSWDAFDV